MLFAFVQPALKISVGDGVVMNGNEYVGIHAVGAFHPPEEPSRSILMRHHEEGRAETSLHQFFFDALCQFQIENIFSHPACTSRTWIAHRVPDIKHDLKVPEGLRSAACPSSSLVIEQKQDRSDQKPRTPLHQFVRTP